MFSYSARIIFAAILVHAFAAPSNARCEELPEHISADELSQYYSRVSQGTIVPNQALIDSLRGLPGYRFKLVNDFGPAFDPSMPRKLDYNNYVQVMEQSQDLFKLDVPRYIELTGSRDFLEAKRKFYSEQYFHSYKQIYDHRYAYLSSWQSLFHPPIKTLEQPIETYVAEFAPFDLKKAESEFFSPDFQRKLDEQTQTHLTFGNELKLLPNKASYEQKLRFVREAKKTLYVAVMAFICDDSTKELVDAIIQKKREGVDVRVIVDSFFRFMDKGCMTRMDEGGIDLIHELQWIHPGDFTDMFHVKFWVKDNEEAIIGGMNILKVDNLSTGFNRFNRDSDLLVRGPTVTDLSDAFVRTWKKYRHFDNHRIPKQVTEEIAAKKAQEQAQGLRGSDLYESVLSDPDKRMKGVCRLAVQKVNASEQKIVTILKAYAQASKKHVVFTTPELSYSPDDQKNDNAALMRIFMDKARSGIPIDVISNGYEGGFGEISEMMRGTAYELRRKYFHLLTPLGEIVEQAQVLDDRLASRKSRKRYVELARIPNFRGWTYFNYIHAKQYLFDGIASFVGSWNIEDHAAEMNNEAGVLCLDESLRDQLQKQLTLDLVNSVPAISSNGR